MTTDEDVSERNHGEQPLKTILEALGLTPHALVAASGRHLTHKQVTKGCRGRRLTRRMQFKILDALNTLSPDRPYRIEELFSYEGD